LCNRLVTPTIWRGGHGTKPSRSERAPAATFLRPWWRRGAGAFLSQTGNGHSPRREHTNPVSFVVFA
jgi:hypothetical protein